MQRMASNTLRFGSYKKAHGQSDRLHAESLTKLDLLSLSNQMTHNLISLYVHATHSCADRQVCVCTRRFAYTGKPANAHPASLPLWWCTFKEELPLWPSLCVHLAHNMNTYGNSSSHCCGYFSHKVLFTC